VPAAIATAATAASFAHAGSVWTARGTSRL
jgi:hypothetical protein